jgi:hypothetical protein
MIVFDKKYNLKHKAKQKVQYIDRYRWAERGPGRWVDGLAPSPGCARSGWRPMDGWTFGMNPWSEQWVDGLIWVGCLSSDLGGGLKMASWMELDRSA